MPNGDLEKPKFKVGQRVYLQKSGSREGPYLIATVASGKCTLCLEDGEPVITTSQSHQANDSSLWPTYDNVISALEGVTSVAKAGDFAYIHYSGHGTRKPPSGEFSNQSTGDLALVLFKGGEERRVRYLWGYELARLLKAMVDKGLVITLVLDCCFSGSVYRLDGDAGIRFLPYDAEIESEHPLDPNESPVSEAPAYRDASTLPNWLINPDKYAILAACGPQEVASEPKFDGQPHGAMSYFLLEIIKSVGITKRHKDIYGRLCAKFRGSGLRRQNPVLYGNESQGFFGQTIGDITTVAAPVVLTRSGTLELQAGHAHGVSDGDLFMLYPLRLAEYEPQSQGPSVVSKVSRTGPLTIGQVSDLLEHLSRFQLVKNLSNEALVDSFRESYDVKINSGGKDYSSGVQIEVKHGAIAELIVTNRGETPFYAFVYNLGPSWQVENVYQGTYIVVTPRNDGERFIGTTRKSLRMKVPERVKEQGYRSCDDIVKVFITSRPTSFGMLELPRLGGSMKASRPNRTAHVGEGPETWATMNFPIRTFL
ncbi:hypothetical protein OIDMADRAFT_100465 [Oidiodendron maius Zn]|uniref:Peptidase C14 caspase domain-containing protein n=1 Tax=Oidiodendron maius (strain Zn) TaxID=913774 RepID=A0A0C3DC67_OIDMZ|nr:hypothetical protein OIDMADRAFT_100465 [Oidiodendron maius Zn]